MTWRLLSGVVGEFERRRREVLAGRVEWGPWRYGPRTNSLICTVPGYQAYEYEVDLARCATPADVLEWLAHLAEKRWGTADVLGAFVLALHEVAGLRSLSQGRHPA